MKTSILTIGALLVLAIPLMAGIDHGAESSQLALDTFPATAVTAAGSAACLVAEDGGKDVPMPWGPITTSLTSCQSRQGGSCSTPGTKVRCQWAPFEPGLCVCSSSHIWVCG